MTATATVYVTSAVDPVYLFRLGQLALQLDDPQGRSYVDQQCYVAEGRICNEPGQELPALLSVHHGAPRDGQYPVPHYAALTFEVVLSSDATNTVVSYAAKVGAALTREGITWKIQNGYDAILHDGWPKGDGR